MSKLLTDDQTTLRELADRLCIQDLIVLFARALDTTDPDLYRQIFADEAEIRLEDGHVMWKGIDGIMEMAAYHQMRFNPEKRPGTTSYMIMRHEVMNATVALDGDRASSDYYLDVLAYNDQTRRPEIITCTRQEDEYVKREGQWKITSSTLIFMWEHEELCKRMAIGPYTPEEYQH